MLKNSSTYSWPRSILYTFYMSRSIDQEYYIQITGLSANSTQRQTARRKNDGSTSWKANEFRGIKTLLAFLVSIEDFVISLLMLVHGEREPAVFSIALDSWIPIVRGFPVIECTVGCRRS